MAFEKTEFHRDPVEKFATLPRETQANLLASVPAELSIRNCPIWLWTLDDIATDLRIEENYFPDTLAPRFTEAEQEEEYARLQERIFERLARCRQMHEAAGSPARRTLASLRETIDKRTRTPEEPVCQQIQLQLFHADAILDYSLRDEIRGMEIPMYSLTKIPDRGVWRWQSQDGKKYIQVSSQLLPEQMEDGEPRPGEVVAGRATIFDKDIIIYSISKLNEALNRGIPAGPTLRFTAYDFFKATSRRASGADYENMLASLRRLRSTLVETNVISEDGTTTRISGIINEGEIKRGPRGDLQHIEIQLAGWLYEAVREHKVLTISPSYFELRRPIERAIYSLARKHCGHQGKWEIELQKLKDKVGAAPAAPLRKFAAEIRRVIEEDRIPQYRLALKERGSGTIVLFYSRDAKIASAALTKKICG